MLNGSSASTALRGGSRPMRARTRKPSTSAAGRRVRAGGAGTRSTRDRRSAGSREKGLPEPFCLVVSLVNPHDVLGYPASYEAGGYSAAEFRDLGVDLPPTVDEDLSDKPTVHTLMRLGMTAYLGPLRGRRAKLDYVNFYAYLHRVVDEKIGRLLRALGDAEDPTSLRSRTVIVRCSDHGEMGLAHGGLRQKMFNTYEETIHVPLVVSNPVLFPRAVTTDRARVAHRHRPDPALAREGEGRRRAARKGSDADPERACLCGRRAATPLRRRPRPGDRAPGARSSRSRTPSTSPTTTTRRRPHSRTSRASRTGSAAFAIGA